MKGWNPCRANLIPAERIHAVGSQVLTIVGRGTMVEAVVEFPGLVVERDGETYDATSSETKLRSEDDQILDWIRAASQPVGVRFSLEGEVLGYRFAPKASAASRNFVRALIARFTFPVPEEGTADAAADQWSAEAADDAGRYLAKYTVKDRAEGSLEIERLRLRYVELSSNLKQELKHGATGTAQGTWTNDLGWIHHATVAEDLWIDQPTGTMRIHFGFHGSLEFRSVRFGVSAIELRDGVWGPAGGNRTLGDAPDHAAEKRANEVRGWTLQRVLAELEVTIDRHGNGSDEVSDLWRKLWVLLEEHPALAAQLGEQLAVNALSPEIAGIAISALGAAGTELGQQVLTETYRNPRLPEVQREEAVISLIQVEEPTLAALVGLRDAAQGNTGSAPVSSAALRAMGAFAANPEARYKDGTTPLQALLAMEGEAARRGELIPWLDGLGNSGSPQILPRVTHYLNFGDPDQQSVAAYALRLVRIPLAIETLARRLVDADLDLAYQIVRALAEQGTVEAQDTMKTIARKARHASLREAAIVGLDRCRRHTPNVVEVIRGFLTTETDPGVLATIRDLLNEHRTPSSSK